MAYKFNAIACALPFPSGTELEIAGMLMARVINNVISCPNCGQHYSLIISPYISGKELYAAAEELQSQVLYTCGDHPPIIQKQ